MALRREFQGDRGGYMRSRLWSPQRKQGRNTLPLLANIMQLLAKCSGVRKSHDTNQPTPEGSEPLAGG